MKFITSASCRLRQPVQFNGQLSWHRSMSRGIHDSPNSSRGQKQEGGRAQRQSDETSKPEAISLPEIDSVAKVLKTTAGELPLSPLMDPNFHEARSKYHKASVNRKKVPGYNHPRTAFQYLIRRNPYARALASPVRKCSATSTCVPRDLLQGFNLVTHPETERPWFVPKGLEKFEPPVRNDGDGDAALDEAPDLADNQEVPEVDEEPPALPTHQPKAPQHIHVVKTGPTGYFIPSQKLLASFDNQRSIYDGGNKRLLRHNHSKSLIPTLNTAVWREDMDTRILELMRRRVVDHLLFIANLRSRDTTDGDNFARHVVSLDSWDAVSAYKHRGCLIFLGHCTGADYIDGEGGAAAAAGAPSTSGPAEMLNAPPATRQAIVNVVDNGQFNKKVPAYDLRLLLGEEHLDRLRRECPHLRRSSLFLLCGRRTNPLQMRLWRLDGYMS
ncbi:hypothetical protein B0T17DRAFT_518936 [Bombardia bombarda]|uniref:Uncharacterized protein n=1 Tax=Bombardia bombarda TaxID=252184 RepID=A0AA40CFH5_9PEZI|nr:hypothetical protein B0T17DRAFT_518936 [Bombardia bombarda]